MSNRKMGGVARFKVYPGGDVTTECADCGLVMHVPQRLFPEERAVIEAAEAWYQTAGNGAPVNLDEVLLHQAVEALQAAKEVE
ncbi:MAG TPA: hypothetical protein VMW58_14480 [Anaerolineae bacterium]|nr:hypothetical protein [Anaerolineae bacterium]